MFGESDSSNSNVAKDIPVDSTVPPTGFYSNAKLSINEVDFPDYEIVRLIGAGGMGQVFEAREKESGRQVALKLLTANVEQDQESVDRFLREGQLAAQLSHPRSTFIYVAGVNNGKPYIAMELMPGRTLQDEIDQFGAMPVNRAVDYILDVIDGLAAAHEIGVIHRDVKPSNCFLDAAGRVKIGDFGLSKSLEGDLNLTKTGTFMGTPSYSSPEQVRGSLIGAQTDIYSVGATLFTLLTGRMPYEGDAMSVTAQIISEPPRVPSKFASNIPAELIRSSSRRWRKPLTNVFRISSHCEFRCFPCKPRIIAGATRATFGRFYV
ncbi:MAG: serine/threonine-protein kinase [Pirellulaceae bacterium]